MGRSWTGFSPVMIPALLIKISIGPAFSACFRPFSTDLGSVTSISTAVPTPPALVTSSAVCWIRSFLLPAQITFAPACPAATASAFPNPDPAPVIRMTLSLRSMDLPRNQCCNLGGRFLDHFLGYFCDKNGPAIPPIQTTEVVAENESLDF